MKTDEKVRIFADIYQKTHDPIEAARAICRSDAQQRWLRMQANKYMQHPEVLKILQQEEVSKTDFSRENLRQRILQDLNREGITQAEKRQLYSLYERVTKSDEDKTSAAERQKMLEQLEVGDALERFIDGDDRAFKKYFQIDGKQLRLKKKELSLEERKQAMLCLLTVLRKQSSFGEYI